MRTVLVAVLAVGLWEALRWGHVAFLRYWWHQNH